ncbi:MAG: SDR family NAD(P)-dependent oxidoreductase [Nitriliruptoraceae bacterium]
MSDTLHLVIGATGATGSATVARLRAADARVVLAGRDGDELAHLAEETDAEDAHKVDARDLTQMGELIAGVVETYGRLDGVANLVGSVLLKPAHLTTSDEWAETIAVNLTSAFAVVRTAAPLMAKAGGGSIVLAASAAAQTGIANHEAIAAAKGGVIGLTRSAAATYGARGVRVNAVAPGLVDAKMTAELVGNQAQAEASRAMHVLGRLGTGADVAAAVTWLLDPATSWVTGQIVGVDGGLAHVRTRPRR